VYCQNCGTQNDNNNFRCTNCNSIIQVLDIPVPPPIDDNASIRMILPVGRSVWAIIAGYLGLFSLLLIPAPLALVTGIIAVKDIRKHPQRHGMGRAIFAIIVGTFFTVILIIFTLVLLPNY